MFEAALKGTKRVKAKKWGAFGRKDTNRWKKEGSVKSMIGGRKLKVDKYWK